MDYDKLRILDFRFGVCDDSGETRFGGEREGVKNLLSPDEGKESNPQATTRRGLCNSLATKVGRAKYAMAEYEKIKQITVPLVIDNVGNNRSWC